MSLGRISRGNDNLGVPGATGDKPGLVSNGAFIAVISRFIRLLLKDIGI